MRPSRFVGLLAAAVALLSCDAPEQDIAPIAARASPVSVHGAIFTTTPDGAVVNENVRYKSKLEVYLDGGPGPNAPMTAAGLPDGVYYFQVTDPSGKVLLSEDPAKCRMVRVQGGVIVGLVVPAVSSYQVRIKGKWVTYACHIQDEPDGVAGPSGRHDTNTDSDHGATVVQLMPFHDTPNKGGVYKAWIITEAQYIANGGDPDAVPVPTKVKGKQVGYERDDGFGPSRHNVKTDNFKVKGGPDKCPMALSVRKFNDKDLDGVKDADEPWITGWGVSVTDPLGVTNAHWTDVTLAPAVTGIWTVVEQLTAGTRQTVAMLDGVAQLPLSPRVDMTFACGDSHEVVYGNGCIDGKVTACKRYDADFDGAAEPGDLPVAGFKMTLSGTDVTGGVVDKTQLTGADGCTTFSGLLPGSYTVTEVLPSAGGWLTLDTNPKSATVSSTVVGATPMCSATTVTFANFCTGTADFDTKGYWHNKNGLAELTQADINHVNGLLPYSAPSSYFGAGDEPFDGQHSGGDVPAAQGPAGELLAPAGSAKAEISHFLVDSNGGGDPREQLAQQLLAFIFNVRHRLDGDSASVQLPDSSWVVASDLIAQAITAWSGSDGYEQHRIATLLDGLNNNNAVLFVHARPCAVTYP